jgi:hypothetical protein
MRKKSHISLAQYLINSKEFQELLNHKKSFYIGSILPDCVPTFITRRHCIEDTFEILKEEIKKITDNYDVDKGITRYYCRHLGVITHYVADYFTFPHNEIFTGTILEHCNYEKDLKFALKAYVKSDMIKHNTEEVDSFRTVDEICDFIKKMHKEYLNALKAIKIDCMYIVDLCYRVVNAILKIFQLEFQTNRFIKIAGSAY